VTSVWSSPFDKATWGTDEQAKADIAAIEQLNNTKWEAIIEAAYAYKMLVDKAGKAKKSKLQSKLARATLRLQIMSG
jgi:hypothetical protein